MSMTTNTSRFPANPFHLKSRGSNLGISWLTNLNTSVEIRTTTLKLNNKTDSTIIPRSLIKSSIFNLFSHHRNGFHVCVGNHPRIVMDSAILLIAGKNPGFTDWTGITCDDQPSIKMMENSNLFAGNTPTYGILWSGCSITQLQWRMIQCWKVKFDNKISFGFIPRPTQKQSPPGLSIFLRICKNQPKPSLFHCYWMEIDPRKVSARNLWEDSRVEI